MVDLPDFLDTSDAVAQAAPKPKAKPRGIGERFKDAYIEAALHNPMGAEAIVRAQLKKKGYTADQINAVERRMSEQLGKKRAADRGGTLQARAVGQIVDLAGGILGGVDPTYLLGPGKTVLQRVGAQAGINAGQNVASQGIEIKRGVRDRFDPREAAFNAAAGAVFQGTVEGVRSHNTGRKIFRGSRDPEFGLLHNTVVHLEGGGTLERPKTSPKGAKGPMQVMDATARDPGFGIRPWDGKTEADRARVGRQYLAVMNDRYGGDKAKVLAAYNAGPGRVDKAVRKYGEEWAEHMPLETRKYIKNGMSRMDKPTNYRDDFDSPNREERVAERTDAMLRMDGDQLEEQFAKDQAEFDGLVNEIKDANKIVEDNNEPLSREIDDGVNPHTDSDLDNSLLQIEETKDFIAAIQRAARLNPRWKPGDLLMERINKTEDMVHSLLKITDWGKSTVEGPTRNLDTDIEKLIGKPSPVDKTGPLDRAAPNPRPDLITDKEWRDMPDEQRASMARDAKRLKDFDPTMPLKFKSQKDIDNLPPDDVNLDQPFPDFELDNHNHAKTFLNENNIMRGRTLRSMTNSQAMDLAKKHGFDQRWHDYYDAARRHSYDPSVKVPDRPSMSGEDNAWWDPTLNNGKGGWGPIPGEEPRADAGGGGQEPPRQPPDEPPGPPEPPPERPEMGAGGPRGPRSPYDGLDPEEKLLRVFREAKPISATQRAISHEIRSEQSGYLRRLQQEGRGLEGHKMQKAALRGQHPLVDFESFARHFTDEDIDILLNRVDGSNSLREFEKINAKDALLKLLGAEGAKIPTPHEIKLLSGVFSEDLIRELLTNRSLSAKMWDAIGNIVNFPRTIMSSYDLSAPFRQGLALVGTKEFWKSYVQMFKYFGSKNAFDASQEAIKNHPNFLLSKDAGLMLADMGHYFSDREEAFMSQWATKIPGVRMSNQAYVGFLNKLRFDTFNKLVEIAQANGTNVAHDTKALRAIANYVNSATGRGSLGKYGNAAAPALASVFFSPRLVASRLNMLLNPTLYTNLPPGVRKEAMKNLLTMAGAATVVLGLAKAAGAEISTDPTSSDFLKAKFGNTRYDILGGFQQYLVFLARMGTGKITGGDGKERDLTKGKFGQNTRGHVAENFARGKLNPSAGYVADWMFTKNVIGEKFEWGKNTGQLFIPMAAQDIAEVITENENHVETGILGVPAIFGVGVSTYAPKPPKSEGGKDEFDLPEFLETPSDDFLKVPE